MKSFVKPSTIARTIAAAILFWSLSKHQYGFYTLLRWAVCATGAYCAYVASTTKKDIWSWAFGIIALFFNPFFPVKMDRASWSNLDIVVGITLLVSIYFVRENVISKGNNNV